jgi:hypothetical protein
MAHYAQAEAFQGYNQQHVHQEIQIILRAVLAEIHHLGPLVTMVTRLIAVTAVMVAANY